MLCWIDISMCVSSVPKPLFFYFVDIFYTVLYYFCRILISPELTKWSSLSPSGADRRRRELQSGAHDSADESHTRTLRFHYSVTITLHYSSYIAMQVYGSLAVIIKCKRFDRKSSILRLAVRMNDEWLINVQFVQIAAKVVNKCIGSWVFRVWTKLIKWIIENV